MIPKFAILYDLETSGLDSKKHDIIQLAAIAFDLESREEVGEFEAKIQFDQSKADKQALEVNSFDPDVWEAEAISSWEFHRRFDEFCSPFNYMFISQRGNKVYTGFGVGHNSERFDNPFLHEWYRRLGLWCPIGFKGLDTMQMALLVEVIHNDIDFNDNHKLENVARVLGLEIPETLHDALNDIRLNAKVFKILLERIQRGVSHNPVMGISDAE